MMLVSLIAAAIPATCRISEGVFEIGLPFSFFRVYASEANGFAAHFGIGTFIGNLIIAYIICYITRKIIKKD